jgi:L-threonylcarbamoyladenylate synthase
MTTDARRTTQRAPAAPETIAAAAETLRAGGLVAMPTETVYGLAADATAEAAVAAIYAAKGRPAFNPLIAHVLGLDAAREHGAFDADAEQLARAFWPGPLTLITPVAPTCKVSLLARAGLDTLALRAPDHPVAQALIAAAGRPLAAPSANRSGHVSPTTADHVLADLDGRIDWILDAGPSRHGVESTIVACLPGGPTLLRPGAVPREALEETLGRVLAEATPPSGAPTAPGQLASHYAPNARLRLHALDVGPDEAALDFGGALTGAPSRTRLDLSPAGDLAEAAANLFAYLRALDASGAAMIAVAPIPGRGLGAAINDRLRRAAAPRDA